MDFKRIWSMPNSRTFNINPIKDLLIEEVDSKNCIWIDAFANESKIANITNDLNAEYKTDYHMDAVDFFKLFKDNSVDGVLYDPPYSLRQVSECYKKVGKEVTNKDTQSSWRTKHINEISRILKIGGKAICFGWNSSGVGIVRKFRLDRILLVPHGGSHNDTIVTVEIKEG